MKRYINLVFCTVIVFLAMQSCTKKEAALESSTENQGYIVPQGNSDYDADIVARYNKYRTYLLYHFTDQDTYWTPNGWKNAFQVSPPAGAWTAGYEMIKADPAFVKKQLVLLDSTWFQFYSDKFLDEFLPVKIMLCSKVDSVYSVNIFTTTPVSFGKGGKSVAAWYNYDNICVNNGSSGVDTLSTANKKNYLAKVNSIFIQSIIGRNLAKATPDFAAIANYTLTITTSAQAYANGTLSPFAGATADRDWGAYMQAIMTTSLTNLNANIPATDATFKGILNATKDVNGKIRARYNLVRNYFISNYNVDLQVIGNRAD